MMEKTMNSSNPLLVSVLAVFPILCFVILIKHVKSRGKNLPPSPRKLPIIGNLHQIGDLPHKTLEAMASKLGPLMFVHFGSTRYLVVSSADAIDEITKNHDTSFSNRPPNTSLTPLKGSGLDMVYSPYGDHWKQVRKVSALHLLSKNVVYGFQSAIRDEEISDMLKTIQSSALKRSDLDLSDVFLSLVNNVVYRSFTGRRYEEVKGMSFGEWDLKFKKLMGAFCFGDLYPSFAWMDRLTGYTSNLKRIYAELDVFMEHMISESRGQQGYLDGLFHLEEEQKLEYLKDIKAIAQGIYVAAVESVALELDWIMSELIRHPEAMRKVQEEVRGIVGNKTKITSNDVDQMHYLKCVIKETTRLHPPGIIPREIAEDVKIYGYEIPAKTKVLVNAHAIQSDPKIWEKPKEFVPERFEGTKIDYMGNHKGFIPFGFGRRNCPGMSLGVALLEDSMANLLYWYDWEMPKGSKPQDLSMDETFQFVVSRKYPLRLVPVARFPVD
ncbi:PREDICTED: cytochrome P450 71A1-like [Tarenaya hassleriana]|uniref:cytochrome P450 71A1-like n=1 Tax=Tarenaya hassleriana TaxID=28532 RepID=UPI00053C3586|nr:PREDICTED: cytochrome P450 71A1-like [Tarenaya hassleriana]